MSLKRKATELALAEAKKPKANGNIAAFFGAPKQASTVASGAATAGSTDGEAQLPAASTAPAVKFDKEAWVAKLSDEQRELLKLEIDTLHESWLAHLKSDLLAPSFLELKRFLKKEKETGKTVFPPEQDIYSWCVALSNYVYATRISASTFMVNCNTQTVRLPPLQPTDEN